MSFNPDEYLKNKAAFDPDAYLKNKPSQLTSAAVGLGQGALMGFGDEIVGAVKGVAKTVAGEGSLPENYAKARDEARAFVKEAEQANPVAYTVGNLAGGVTSSLIPGLNVAKGAGLLATAGKSALSAGITALGESEAKDVGGLVGDVAKGAAFGAALPVAIKGLQKITPGLRGASEAVNKATAAASKLTGTTDEAGAALYKRMLSNPDEHKRVRDAAKALKGGESLEVVGDQIQGLAQGLKKASQGAYGDTLKAGVNAALQDPETYQASRAKLASGVQELASVLPTDKKDPFYNKAVARTFSQVKGFLEGADPLAKAAEKKGKEELAQALAEGPLRARQAVDTTLSAMRAKGETSGFAVERLRGLRDLLDNEVKSLPGMAEMDKLYGEYKNVSKVLARNALDKEGNIAPQKLEKFLATGGGAGSQGQIRQDWETLQGFFAGRGGNLLPEAASTLAKVGAERESLSTARAISRLGAETGGSTGKTLAPLILGTTIGGPAGLAAAAASRAVADPVNYLRAVGYANDMLLKLNQSELTKLALDVANREAAKAVNRASPLDGE